MGNAHLEELRNQVDTLNIELLKKISERANLVQEIGKIKGAQGSLRFDPVREREMLNQLVAQNGGPFDDSTIEHLFKEIFKAGLELQEEDHSKALLVSRKSKQTDTVVDVDGVKIGNGEQIFVFGPCSVESYDQVAQVAAAIKEKGLKFIRGGAFKPRTSPYDFQGLGVPGLEILKRIREEYNLRVISEIVTPADIETALDYVDVIQIGARNMQNFELLKEAGRVNKPILLKRGLSATIEEFIGAAEYIMSQGNGQIVLCERGIRTYEKATRNTLDISAVPILKKETHLPVMVDVTHSTGRKDLLLPCAKAALAIDADGVMAEVHPDPAVALSDAAQQMNLPEFDVFWKEILSSNLMKQSI
ncbi:bifunctional 3-deoxy-7-phosphoheptulonate synthase/chorismate mutase [Listeria ilorinensis]|uniref:bifunctional 3-deoxy-7-phosphoheptulonate synthase/chorismate mutase n=1 Tax=Listeria ilorinensis TaxID=2867439 RepID=UPI001EF5E376|nr:bifunctional 3-deoxy-7-phosphoheptulonate synthase/chorismate mutase [Listeria ilorinensis]